MSVKYEPTCTPTPTASVTPTPSESPRVTPTVTPVLTPVVTVTPTPPKSIPQVGGYGSIIMALVLAIAVVVICKKVRG